MINIKYNSFFNKEGFLLDDAYDPFKRIQYINYFKEHQTEYICCQDADLKNLVGFIGIQYLTIPEEADNYQELEKTGLCETRRGLGSFVTEDTGRIGAFRQELAQKAVRTFLSSMEMLGISREEAAQMIVKEG